MLDKTHQTSPLWRPFGILDAIIDRIEAFILAAGILLMAGNTIANVAGRFLFDKSILFSEELNQFLIIIITFAGIGYAARRGRHIRMSAIFDHLPDKVRKILMIIIAVTTAICMFILMYYSYEYLLSVKKSGRILPALQWPVYWSLVWVPIGVCRYGDSIFIHSDQEFYRKRYLSIDDCFRWLRRF